MEAQAKPPVPPCCLTTGGTRRKEDGAGFAGEFKQERIYQPQKSKAARF